MKFDYVHDIQSAFRKLVTAISNPGDIVDMSEEAEKLDLLDGCYQTNTLLMLMLLDTEVTFILNAKKAQDMTVRINQLTYSKIASIDQADYVFYLHDSNTLVIEQLTCAKRGTLVDPQQSATFVIEVDHFLHGKPYAMSGPGIDQEKQVYLSAPEGLVEKREEANQEYPLGIDLILIDAANRLIAIPRTTKLMERVVK